MIAIARSWKDFQHEDVLTYVYFFGLVGTLGAIAMLDLSMHPAEEPQVAA